MLDKCFKGHGTFLYEPDEMLARYNGDANKLADAMLTARMQHVWVRLHDVVRPSPGLLTKKIVTALRAKGLHVAGYGWCHGADPAEEAKLATDQLNLHGLTHYVANIEHGKKKGAYGEFKWTPAEIKAFFKRFRELAEPSAQVLISTYPFIGWHKPELMVAANPHVDGFAPQVYWFDYPAENMWPRPDLPPGAQYILQNPASYARLCLDMWRHYTTKPLVVTGQAYWTPSEGKHFDQPRAEAKLNAFLHDMTDADWSRIARNSIGGTSATRRPRRRKAKCRHSWRPRSPPQSWTSSPTPTSSAASGHAPIRVQSSAGPMSVLPVAR